VEHLLEAGHDAGDAERVGLAPLPPAQDVVVRVKAVDVHELGTTEKELLKFIVGD